MEKSINKALTPNVSPKGTMQKQYGRGKNSIQNQKHNEIILTPSPHNNEATMLKFSLDMNETSQQNRGEQLDLNVTSQQRRSEQLDLNITSQ